MWQYSLQTFSVSHWVTQLVTPVVTGYCVCVKVTKTVICNIAHDNVIEKLEQDNGHKK